MTSNSSPLVSAGWLREHLHDPHVRLVDTRFTLGKPEAGRAAFESGHIPGAIFVDLEKDLSLPVRGDRVGGRHPLPSPEQLAGVLTRLGITNQTHVVAYDDPSTGAAFYAPHFWWMLRYLGHDDMLVSVLDGGLPAWTRDGGALEQGAASTAPEENTAASYQPSPRPEMLADADYVENRPDSTAVIDSRAPERFRGETEPLDWKAGHIPGAVNRNWADGINKDGTWKSCEEQLDRLGGIARAVEEVVLYCGSGVSACGNLLALELAGIPGNKVRLYAGSWSDWISGENARPVATGDGGP
jgi:thiosulfate/3-mercaptopyruvate sulfurtransferase